MTDRATSTTLSYVLTLSIATLLVAGLILAGSTFVEDRREQVIRQELRVIGEHLASNVEQVDRYATASDGLGAASVELTLPARVTGSTYVVVLEGGSDPVLLLNATNPDVDVAVNLTVRRPVASESFADGGSILVECETSASPCELRIDNA